MFYWRIFVSLLCLSLGSCPKAQGLDEGFYLGMDAFAAENYEVAAIKASVLSFRIMELRYFSIMA